MPKKKNSDEGAQSLQELIQQASHYDSLHELLHPKQSEQTLTQEIDELDVYEILRPDSKTDIMMLFAPEHLKSQNPSSNSPQAHDSLNDLLLSEPQKTGAAPFKTLPMLNQREHHSAVVGGLMELNNISSPPVPEKKS